VSCWKEKGGSRSAISSITAYNAVYLSFSYIVYYFQEKARLGDLLASTVTNQRNIMKRYVETDSGPCLFHSRRRSLMTSVPVENRISVLFDSSEYLMIGVSAISIHIA